MDRQLRFVHPCRFALDELTRDSLVFEMAISIGKALTLRFELLLRRSYQTRLLQQIIQLSIHPETPFSIMSSQ